VNIFEALREDHDKMREMLDRLIETHGDSETRRELLQKTRNTLHDHEVAEERHF